MTTRLRLALLAAVFAVARPAAAETLVFEPSTARVEITSNFSGTTLTVYGTVERDAASVGRAGDWDIAVALVGPNRSVVTRRKDRVAGLWVNLDSRTWLAPGFYAVASTRPIGELAAPEVLKPLRLGFDALTLPELVDGVFEIPAGEREFRDALFRLESRAGLYAEYPKGVRRIGDHLWTATLPIPAEVPVGPYRVRAVLFAGGVPLADEMAVIEVVKTGFEQQVADLAAHRPILYGLVSVVIAMLTGWLGGVLFRRD